jgi:hypothetical protein
MMGCDAQLGAAKIHEAYVGPWSWRSLDAVEGRWMAYILSGWCPETDRSYDGSDAQHGAVRQQEHGWSATCSRMIGDRKNSSFEISAARVTWLM